MSRRSKKLVWLILAGVILSLSTGTLAVGFYISRTRSALRAGEAAPVAPLSDVASLGRIQPGDGMIRIGARSLSGQPSLVRKLLVKEGEHVKTGDLIAVLDSQQQLEAAWRSAISNITVAQARLAQVQAGAKPAELEAQKAEIARFESELAIAKKDLYRSQELQKEGVLSQSVLDQNWRVVASTSELLNQAKHRLDSVAEVRQVDLHLAAAQVEAAIAEEKRAKAEFLSTQIRSPTDGLVVQIHTWPGEEVGADGILDLANTETMYVIAEVVETDVKRVKVGQRAAISGDVLAEALQGTVECIRPRVAKNSMLDLDPTVFSDTRIIEVKIRLDDNKVAAGLIHAQVKVKIKP